ncbi:MAG TPA: hypothetical protein VMJ64_13825 [Anaerolineales bacterium]|nr:hypothetical protein [Anaerolineales bacterium]
MNITIPEKNKKPGVCYVATDDGVELPVVDITNPAFDPVLIEEKLPQFTAKSTRYMELWAGMPGFARKFMSGRSIFTDQLSRKGGGFVTGMTTYLMKLGSANLGKGYAHHWDYEMADSLPMLSVQARLRAMAKLLMEELAGPLGTAARAGSALHLLNIAGGCAADSWNTLLLIQREHPEWLAGRRILVRVFDKDSAGPSFGSRALAALLEEGAPLHGLDVVFEHTPYDWSQPGTLKNALGDLGRADALVAGSSEGGLFEYGTDDEISTNLSALGSALPKDFFLVGSLFRNERLTRAMKRMASMDYRLRDEAPFRELMDRSGWCVERTWMGNPVYWGVVVRPREDIGKRAATLPA